MIPLMMQQPRLANPTIGKLCGQDSEQYVQADHGFEVIDGVVLD